MKATVLFFTLAACSGADGKDGEDGRDGRDGERPEIAVSEASASECPTGGKIVSIDGEDVVVCNAGSAPQPSDSLGRIEASLYCGGALTGTTSLWASHSAVVFTDRSIWAQASIRDGLLEVGSSAFYSPQQKGAVEANVLFSFDVAGEPNGGFWTVTIDAESLDSVLHYEDSDISAGSMDWSMPSSSSGCVVNRY